MDEASIAAIRAELGRQAGIGGAFSGVWPQHVEAVALFVAASTQWRTVTVSVGKGLGVLWIGLDYDGVRFVAEATGVRVDAVQLGRLRILELSARAALNGAAA